MVNTKKKARIVKISLQIIDKPLQFDEIEQLLTGKRDRVTSKVYKVQAAATLLGITTDSLRRNVDESKVNVIRNETGPRTRIFSVENIYEIAAWRARKKNTAKKP